MTKPTRKRLCPDCGHPYRPNRGGQTRCHPCNVTRRDTLKPVRLRVAKARLNGELPRQPCEVCGDPKTDGHHDDYSKPLEIRWLCRSHHRQHHIAQNRAARRGPP